MWRPTCLTHTYIHTPTHTYTHIHIHTHAHIHTHQGATDCTGPEQVRRQQIIEQQQGSMQITSQPHGSSHPMARWWTALHSPWAHALQPCTHSQKPHPMQAPSTHHPTTTNTKQQQHSKAKAKHDCCYGSSLLLLLLVLCFLHCCCWLLVLTERLCPRSACSPKRNTHLCVRLVAGRRGRKGEESVGSRGEGEEEREWTKERN